MIEIDQLRAELYRIEIANPKLRSLVDLPVMDFAFFPGGDGLYRGSLAVKSPVGGTLVLGSNFGCSKGFVNEFNRLISTDERCNPTWKGVLERLRRSGIDPDRCFFSNAWPFLHHGKTNIDCPFQTLLRDEESLLKCVSFLNKTLETMKPRLIIALGFGSAAFLGHVWEELSVWKGYSWKFVDKVPFARIRSEGYELYCVAISHPSLPNSRHRTQPNNTCQGEIRLLSEVAESAGITTN
jgi:hypothetical protein